MKRKGVYAWVTVHFVIICEPNVCKCVRSSALQEKHGEAVYVRGRADIYFYVFINARFCTWPSPSARLAKLVTS